MKLVIMETKFQASKAINIFDACTCIVSVDSDSPLLEGIGIVECLESCCCFVELVLVEQ